MSKSLSLKNSRGITLLELLITVAILAILAGISVLVINPAEILKSSRDEQRTLDLGNLNLALSNFESLSSDSMGDPLSVYISIPDSSITCDNISLPSLPTSYSYVCSSEDNYRKTDGTGWIPVNLDSLGAQSTLSALPIDPINTIDSSFYYTYVPGGSWEINTLLESKKYRLSGKKDQTSNDGGDNYVLFETGTNLRLSPIKDSELVSYWPFDYADSGEVDNNQTTGLEDISGGNNGTAKNANQEGMSWTSGQVGGAISFDGADDWVSVGTPLGSLTDFSFVFWVQASDTNQTPAIISHDQNSESGDNGKFSLFSSGSKMKSRMFNGSSFLGGTSNNDMTSSLEANSWYHFIFTYDKVNGVAKFYQDGEEVYSNNFSNYQISNSHNLHIGRNYNSSEWALDKKIDDVRIYGKALSPAEAKILYDGTK